MKKLYLPLYKIYQQKLIDLNSCDFGDLILHTVKILENYPDIRQIYTTNFKYILVDEYQDTNFIQSKWLNLLSEKTKIYVVWEMMINLFIVGGVRKLKIF